MSDIIDALLEAGLSMNPWWQFPDDGTERGGALSTARRTPVAPAVLLIARLEKRSWVSSGWLPRRPYRDIRDCHRVNFYVPFDQIPKSWLTYGTGLQSRQNCRNIAAASLRPPTMHIRLSDRHAGKAAEAPVVPGRGFSASAFGMRVFSIVPAVNGMPQEAGIRGANDRRPP